MPHFYVMNMVPLLLRYECILIIYIGAWNVFILGVHLLFKTVVYFQKDLIKTLNKVYKVSGLKMKISNFLEVRSICRSNKFFV